MSELDALEAIVAVEARSPTPRGTSVLGGGGSTELDFGQSGSPSHQSTAWTSPASGVKRRRRASPSTLRRGESGFLDDSSVKEELDDDTPTATPRSGSDEDRTCLGCRRHCTRGADWYDPALPITWAFQTLARVRGLWCRDCHNCWRTCYSQSHSLALFGRWLSSSEAHMTNWRSHLRAYASLVYEQNTRGTRITNEMVQKRVDMLNFACAWSGVTFEPSCVMLLSEVLQKLPSAAVEPEALTTVFTDAGARLGVRIPITTLGDRFAAGDAVPRPPCPPPRVDDGRSLSTCSHDDRAALRNLFGTEVPATTVQVKAEPTTTMPPTSKLRTRMDALLVTSDRLVRQFGSNLWEQVKESQFTTPVGKLSGFLAEAGAQGDAAVQATTTTWVNGLTAGKAFLRVYREYGKSRRKQAKLMDLVEPLERFLPFLKETVKVDLDPMFAILSQKVFLFHRMGVMSMCESFSKALDDGLAGTLEAAQTTSAGARQADFSAEAWLRSVVFTLLVDALENGEGKDEFTVKQLVAKLHSNIKAMVRLCRRNNFISTNCMEVIDDMEAIMNVVGCATTNGSVKASEADKSMLRLKDKRLDVLMKAMYSTAMGKIAVSEVSLAIQVSAKDAAATSKMTLALRKLRDERLPRLMPSTTKQTAEGVTTHVVVANFGLICDGSAVEVLGESLAAASESIRMWSPGQIGEHVAEVAEWAEELVSMSVLFGELSCLFLQGLLSDNGVHWWVSPTGRLADETAATHEASTAPQWTDIMGRVESCMHEEQSIIEFAKRVTSFLKEQLPQALAEHIPVAALCARIKDKVEHNAAARQRVTRFVRALSDVGARPDTPGKAVEEWRTMQTLGKQESSYLAKAMQLYEEGKGLTGYPLLVGDWEGGDVILSLDEGAGIKQLRASCQSTSVLQRDLLKCDAHTHACEILSQALQVVADEFAGSMALSTIATPTPLVGPISHESTRRALGSVVQGSEVAEVAKNAGKAFIVNRKHEWPAVALWKLLNDMLNRLPGDDITFSSASFCTEDSPNPPWTASDLTAVGSILLPMSQVAATCAWLQARCFGADESIDRDHRPKDELERAISFVKTTIHATSRNLDSGCLKTKHLVLPCKAPLGACKVWFRTVQNIVGALCRCFVVKYFEVVKSVSQDLAKVTPAHEHIVSDKVLNLKLAKSQLLGWPSRRQLTDTTMVMFNCLRDLARLHSQWAMTPALEEDEEIGEDLKNSQSMFEAGKKVVLIIAGVSTLLEKKGADQESGAINLINTKGSELPILLKEKLESIVNSVPNAVARAVTTDDTT